MCKRWPVRCWNCRQYINMKHEYKLSRLTSSSMLNWQRHLWQSTRHKSGAGFAGDNKKKTGIQILKIEIFSGQPRWVIFRQHYSKASNTPAVCRDQSKTYSRLAGATEIHSTTFRVVEEPTRTGGHIKDGQGIAGNHTRGYKSHLSN